MLTTCNTNAHTVKTRLIIGYSIVSSPVVGLGVIFKADSCPYNGHQWEV